MSASEAPHPLQPTTRRQRYVRWAALGLLGAISLLTVFLLVCLAVAWRPMGKQASGPRLERMMASPIWADGTFRDILPRNEPDLLRVLPKWLETPRPFRRPGRLLSHKNLLRKDFDQPPQTGLRITWLGHSTTLIEIDGQTILTDPVWGTYVAPLPLANMKRFIPPVLPLSELPLIDAVIISHDHYDHLDYPTIQKLHQQTGARFFVPLGVGAHLEYWGVPPSRITELVWWEEASLDGLRMVCTPARHFSGRGLHDRDRTLWASWAIVGPQHRVYFSGDTALFPGFRDIGERFGPFDATMIETGAYNALWADVHLGPEQAVTAHQMLGGGLMIPIHWGMFDLGLHGWTEPIERTLVAAEEAGIALATLRPGERVEPAHPQPVRRWWPKRPWETAEQAPVHSSGL